MTNQLLVVYKTATNLSYQTSSDNGNTWSAVAAVPSSGSAGNSPTLAVTSTYWSTPRTALVNATSGGVGTIFYRYYRNGDSTGWASTLLKNLSQIIPGAYTGHQKPSLTSSGTSSNQTLHVAWEATQVSSGYRLIFHRKATDWVTWPSVYSTTYYQEQQLPSITGLANNTAELLFQYVSQTGVYKMHYDGTNWGVPVSIGDAYGTNPSVSIGNTTAKYVWTSGSVAPYQIKTSTETLSKSTGSPLATVYHRSIAIIDTTTGNWLEVRLDKLAVKTKSGEEFTIPLVEAKEDDKTLTPVNAFINLASSAITLPVEAESLFVHCQVNGQGLSTVKKRDAAINVEITFAPKNAAAFKRSVINIAAEGLPETRRTIAIAASNFAGNEFSLAAQVAGLDNKSSLIASLGHIYEVVETPAGNTLAASAENTTPQEYALSAYPNPFNPSTQIHFAMKETGLATVRVYNLNGQLIRELLNEPRAAGEHTVPWDGRDHRGVAVASGVYFIRFEAGTAVKQSKVMLVR